MRRGGKCFSSAPVSLVEHSFLKNLKPCLLSRVFSLFDEHRWLIGEAPLRPTEHVAVVAESGIISLQKSRSPSAGLRCGDVLNSYVCLYDYSCFTVN